MREKFFSWTAHITYNRAGLVFTLCLVLTVIAGILASSIRMDMTWSALVPEHDPSKATFQKVIDEFGSASQIVIALEGPGEDTLISAARDLESMLEGITAELPGENGDFVTLEIIKDIQVQYDTAYVAQHGLMLVKANDLKKNKVLFTDYNLVPYLTHTNDVLESEYIQNTDNLTKQEKDAGRMLDGLYDFVESLSPPDTPVTSTHVQHAVDALTTGNGYFLSTDKNMLLIFITPTLHLDAPIDQTVIVVNAIDDMLKAFHETHPEIHAGMTGGHVIMRDEMESGMEDTERNVIMAFSIILIIFIVSFRMFSGPLLAMLVLVSGIMWDMGLASLVIGRLSIMTAVCSVILIGLGVDFAIHILSSYSEFRHKGHNVDTALQEALSRIGGGLITGAFTSAFAFIALILTSFPAFREFGFVVGAGIISCLGASLFFLPSAIVLKERLWHKLKRGSQPKMVDMELKFIGAISDNLTKKPLLSIAMFCIITVILAMFIPDVRMNRNYMDMEPEGLESVRLQREIPKRFNMSPDNMVAVLDNLGEVNELTDLLNERPAIGLVESLSDYVPSKQKQAERLPMVRKIAEMQETIPAFKSVNIGELVEQLYRLDDNLTEMSSLAFISGLDRIFDKTNYFLGLDEEGDQAGPDRVLAVIHAIEEASNTDTYLNKYQQLFIPTMKNRISSMANPETITTDHISQRIRDRYMSEDGSHYLIHIYSKKDIWDGLFTDPFLDTVTRDIPGATGMPLLMKAMIEAAKEQGKIAFLVTFAAFFIILIADFRSIKTAVIAALPLFTALVWMLGIMGLTGFPFSVTNVIGLPLILGIGIDDGVHIIHRYKIEGPGRMRYTLSSIGKAIFLTTVTTVLGFGSLIPSTYRGYGSLGTLVVLGISLCFITSVIVLPAFMKCAWRTDEKYGRFFKESQKHSSSENVPS